MSLIIPNTLWICRKSCEVNSVSCSWLERVARLLTVTHRFNSLKSLCYMVAVRGGNIHHKNSDWSWLGFDRLLNKTINLVVWLCSHSILFSVQHCMSLSCNLVLLPDINLPLNHCIRPQRKHTVESKKSRKMLGFKFGSVKGPIF